MKFKNWEGGKTNNNEINNEKNEKNKIEKPLGSFAFFRVVKILTNRLRALDSGHSVTYW